MVDVEGSNQFSHEAEFISLLYVHITFATETEAESTWFAQLIQCWNMLKLLAFKWILNELMFLNKMIRGHVNLVIRLS